jgi:hypothetical protein
MREILLAGVGAAGLAVGIKPALAALSRITVNCVACHSGYRVPD